MIEKSLIFMKPDAVQRGIIGEMLIRFERAGLKIIGAKLITADKDIVKKHYKKPASWHKKIGELNIKDCKNLNLNIKKIFGTTDPRKIGEQVNDWLYEMFDVGPVMTFVLEGPNAVAKIRKLVGSTYPNLAEPGTIRGDFGLDSPISSLKRKRAVFNLIHASGVVEEANEEVKLWFDENELLDYRRIHEDLYSY